MSEKTVAFRDEPLSAEPASYVKPERQTSNPAKRKQTLLALISELSELRDAEDLEKEIKESPPANSGGSGCSGDASQDVQSREGVATFRAFDNHVSSLDRQLQAFANAVRQLGSSVGLLNATYHLRGALFQIEHLFRENAADMFPEVKRKMNRVEGSRMKAERDRVHTGMRPQLKPQRDLELLPDEMDALARQIHVFVNRLNDIPEFTDELVNASFSSFASDLKYRASCLREFQGQIKTIAVQRYINDLSTDIALHMEGMKEALTNFIEVGVPTIRHAQNHTANGLQYLSTVASNLELATFFSGVTATTIQYSFEQTGDTLSDLVNALWIISLIFSIASAINSQLAYHWRAAIYRSPRSYVPWWVAIWIKRSPLFFLIGSVIAFSIGLCVFTYSSNQSRVVSTLVTVFTIVTSSGLISVGLWFMSERWIFSRTRGQRWLFDSLNEMQAKIHKILGITWALRRLPRDIGPRLLRWSRVQMHNIRTTVQAIYTFCTCRGVIDTDEEKQAHQSDYPSPSMPDRPSGPRSDPDASSIADTNHSGPASPRISENRRHPLGSESMASLPSSSGAPPRPSMSTAHLALLPPPPEPEQRPQTKRLKSVVERIMAMNKSQHLRTSSRDRVDSELIPGARRESSEGYSATSFAQKARIREIKPTVGNLQITQFLNEHMALVKHMQFNPNGDLLATCSWDRTAIIWKVGETVELSMKLYHPVSTGGFVNQVAWSPDGSKLLTRTQKAIKVWDPRTGTGQRAISRGRLIQSVSWMPSGNGFLSVEYKTTRSGNVTDTNLVRLDNNGQVVETHTLERIQIWDTAIMEDECRVVAVGTLIRSKDHLQPTAQSRAEKRLLVYNLKTRDVEHHVPLLQEVRNISLCTLSSKITYALVSHEDKSPPQMWRIDMKKVIKANEQVARLILIHSYLTKSPVDFAGQSFFGGPNDSFVCCSSKSGEIYIWDRTSATLLRTLRPDDSEVIKNFACNRKAAPGFMLVSGALDGALRIWTNPSPSPFATPCRQFSSSPEPQTSRGSITPPDRGGSVGMAI